MHSDSFEKGDPNDHVLCDQEDAEGCVHCRPRPSVLCCDLCTPNGFDNLKPVLLPKPSRTMSRMLIPKYAPTDAHHKLRVALEEWHDTAAQSKLGDLIIRQWGSQFFISDVILDCIVDCAGSFKLITAEVLRVETHWAPAHLAEFGQNILDLVAEYFPQPLPGGSTAALTSSSGHTRCSACGQTGHNSMFCVVFLMMILIKMTGANRKCPRHPSVINGSAQKESISLLSPMIHMDTPSCLPVAIGTPSCAPLLPYCPETPPSLTSRLPDYVPNPSSHTLLPLQSHYHIPATTNAYTSLPVVLSSRTTPSSLLPFFQTADSTFNPTSTPRHYHKSG